MPKRYDIVVPKGDYLAIPFSIIVDGEKTKLDNGDLIFMTVSEGAGDKDFVFQKSLENGITFDNETQRYLIEIQHEDTKDINVGANLGYDITIYYGGNKPKQKVIGSFTIGKKYTLNEVV